MANEWMRNRCSICVKQFKIPFKRPHKKFQMDAVNIQTTLNKYQSGNASYLNGRGKIFEWMTPAVRTTNRKFQTGDARNRMAEEKF